jgi:hypothetical protein
MPKHIEVSIVREQPKLPPIEAVVISLPLEVARDFADGSGFPHWRAEQNIIRALRSALHNG